MLLQRSSAIIIMSSFFFSPSRPTAALRMSAPPLNKKSTAQEVVDRFAPKQGLTGRCAVVTGGNSGIGLETCRVLAEAGAKVVLCSRSLEAGESAAASLREELRSGGGGGGGGGDIVCQQLDLASLESVEAAAAGILKELGGDNQALDYLVLNAGIMALPEAKYTKEGYELQVGTNHFGHAHLTNELMEKVQRDNSRVVVLSSTAHNFGTDLDVEDLHYTKGKRKYTPWGAYGQSKACNLLYAQSLAEKLKAAGSAATAFSVHPGVIRTNLWREPQGGLKVLGLDNLLGKLLPRLVADKTIPQGAATTLYACLAPRLDASFPGAYFADCDVAAPNRALTADRPELRERLWEETNAQLAAAVADRRGKEAESRSQSPQEEQQQQPGSSSEEVPGNEKTEALTV